MEDKVKEEIKSSLKRWLTQMAREHNLKDDEVALIGYNYLSNYLSKVIYLRKY